MARTTRALMPDYLRIFALFGIVLVNVQAIGFSVFDTFPDLVGSTTSDRVTIWLVNGLMLLKTYGLFSFMFGVGLGFLMQASARRGLAFGRVYRNRMIGLAILGVLHGCLFFVGDILTIYAIAGSVLYFFRNWAIRRLITMAAVLFCLHFLVNTPLLLLPAEPAPQDFLDFERFALTEGSFVDAVIFRSIGYAFALSFLLILQGMSALAWFCLGLAAVKAGMIDSTAHPLWARARRYCLLPGVVVSLAGAGLVAIGNTALGAILTLLAAPVATLGYLGVIAAIARPPGPFMAEVLAAGGSSLSIYLGQSIVLSTIFSGYGLGLWGTLSYLEATLVAVLVTIGLMAVLTLWRRRHARGPFEWVLRRITYAGQRG